MSYQVLARKWRPQSFAEMVGQNHILRALINALDSAQLHHAYLFTGTRGVGKTTIARILAKCLNCETGITATPCGMCSACVDIRDGKFPDLIEVDAASRTKVEQTRELLENVPYAPTRGRYKIYLIDEVHMLSAHSFNALLKTLEEPPPHVIFLLATTDPERLPMTVLSRCLRFHLKNMPAQTISDYLAQVLTQEQMAFAPEALDLIAQAAEGSMRDSLSLLEQAIAYGKGEIKLAEVRDLLGHIDPEAITHLLRALQHKQGDALLNAVAQLAHQGADYLAVLAELIQALHQLAVLQVMPDTKSAPDYLREFARAFSAEDVQLFYQMALNGRRDLPWAASPRLGFEMILLRMLAFYPKDVTPIKSEPVAIQTPIIKAPATEKPVAIAAPAIAPAPVAAFTPAPAKQNTNSHPLSAWTQIVPELGLTGLSLALASHCIFKSYDDGQLQLSLAPQHAPLFNASSSKRIETALETYLNHKLGLKIILEAVAEETLAGKQAREQQQAQELAVKEIETDPQVQAMVQRLGANVVPESITPL